MAKEGILLESGTNEVEILEFILNGQGFGVNVAKVQAIEQYRASTVTKIPMAPPSLAGMILFRGRTLPLIDLSAEMGIDKTGQYESDDQDVKKIVLILEFNNITSAALADGVNRIYRISWQDISPLSSVISNSSSVFTGSVNIEGREILIVDMEKIVSDILPAARMREITDEQLQHPKQADRSQVKIVLAEDSGTVRAMIVGVLNKGGYTDVTAFDNGKDAYEEVRELKTKAESQGDDIEDFLNILISDIEMPQMDGLTLCRNVKEGLSLSHIPVVMFSSLINEQMAKKCKSVGSDAHISKPQMGELVGMIDKLCLEQAVEAAAA